MKKKIILSSKRNLRLKIDDQFSFKSTHKGVVAINRITKKKWGYYLTDSCNQTLKRNNFKTAIVVSLLSKSKKYFVKIVHKKKIYEFKKYLKENKSSVFMWLDKKKI